MNDEKWLDLIDQVKRKFKLELQETEDVFTTDFDGNQSKIGILEKIVFTNELGKLMVTRKTTSLVIGRDEKYHKKRGTAVTTLTYSPTEKVHRLNLYKWNNEKNDWDEIELKGMFSI